MTTVLRSLTLEQRVGQLFMVGGPATGVGAATRTAISRYHVGNVMLTGRSTLGVAATARVSAGVRARASSAATGGVPILVATDQEGGAVQVLRGSGFSQLPPALLQGGWISSDLRVQTKRWGGQLRAAGIDLDLAPVADTVPSPQAARTNEPIGRYRRQYGYTAARVGSHALAVSQGLRDAGVLSSVKHFPGLGRVTGNPDVTSGVTDRVTRREDPYLQPFARVIDGGAAFVMMSTAYYPRISRRRAAFSPVIIKQLLRGDLHFSGVVISDDLGSARQVADLARGERAVHFLVAGGDLVLTVDPAAVPAMYRAVLARARSDSAFRVRVDTSVARVLRAKLIAGPLR